MNDPSALESAMKDAGLENIAGQAASLARPSIRLHSIPFGERSQTIGGSRLGGAPDLPMKYPWPGGPNGPLAFVAQVRMADAAPLAPPNFLPPTGLLSFFFDAAHDVYGDRPQDQGNWSVLYFPDAPSGLARAPFPTGLPENAIFTPCQLSFDRQITLPSAPAQQVSDLTWNIQEIEKYEAFLNTFSQEDRGPEPVHRMFGYPDQIQDDMQLQSALMSGGFHHAGDPGSEKAMQRKSTWRLLLQVDSDPEAKMSWGSAGRLYFWIETGDLLNRRYDHTWAIIQSD